MEKASIVRQDSYLFELAEPVTINTGEKVKYWSVPITITEKQAETIFLSIHKGYRKENIKKIHIAKDYRMAKVNNELAG